MLTAGMIVYLVEELKRARRISQAHEEELQLINRELTHRISNLSLSPHPFVSKPSVRAVQASSWRPLLATGYVRSQRHNGCST